MPILKDLSFDQPDEYLKKLGWSSGSSLVNNLILIMVLIVFGIVHLILYFINNKQHKCSSTIRKIYKLFTFTLYIRIAIQVCMFNTLMVVSEIKYYVKNGGGDTFGHQNPDEYEQVRGNYVSVIFSLLILILIISFLMLVFILWSKNKNKISIDQLKTRELYY